MRKETGVESYRLALAVLALLAVAGCGAVNRGVFGATSAFPPPYQSGVQITTAGKTELDFEVLGEGYGESTGHAVLIGGLLYMKQPNAMKVYQMAVQSQGGDILLETRTQMEISGFLPPFIYTRAKLRVWGLVARVKNR